MPLINCEFNLELTWSRDCVITNSTGEGKFLITETKFYVRVVTLWTQDNGKLLQKLKSDFRRPIPWNKHESSLKTFAQSSYLNYWINVRFQGVNRFSVLSFGNRNGGTLQSTYYLTKGEIKDDNVIIDGRNFFDQPINSITKRYENIKRIGTGQRDDYTIGCLLDYSYFKENYKLVAIDLSNQEALDADSTVFQQINFKGNLKMEEEATIFFIS